LIGLGNPLAELPALGRSCQFGRASAPTIPQLMQTMRGPKEGIAMLSS
jgi:hypothetical protein